MSKTALLVIDVQNDYFPHGKMELSGAEQALVQINRLEDSFLKNNSPVIYIQHIFSRPDAPFFVVGTDGVKMHAGLRVQASSRVVEKQFPNSFFQTALHAELKKLEVEQLVICGMMTHMCVDATSRAAAELGYQPVIVAEATATKSLMHAGRTVQAEDVQTACLAAFEMFAQVLSVDDYLNTAV